MNLPGQVASKVPLTGSQMENTNPVNTVTPAIEGPTKQALQDMNKELQKRLDEKTGEFHCPQILIY